MKRLALFLCALACSAENAPGLPGPDVAVREAAEAREAAVDPRGPEIPSCMDECGVVVVVGVCKDEGRVLSERCGKVCVLCTGIPAPEVVCERWPDIACVATCGICR